MLLDDREIEIASRASQPGMRNPKVSRTPFERIFRDFMPEDAFEGKELLDWGPGQYDFAELARTRGARVDNIEVDPPLIELGEFKGFKVWPQNMTQFRFEQVGRKYDGVFCKLSISGFCNRGQGEDQFLWFDNLLQTMDDDAWGFLAPWNGIQGFEDVTDEEIERTVGRQREMAKAAGFAIFDLSEDLHRYYGLGSITVDRPLFIRNLRIPPAMEEYQV